MQFYSLFVYFLKETLEQLKLKTRLLKNKFTVKHNFKAAKHCKKM